MEHWRQVAIKKLESSDCEPLSKSPLDKAQAELTRLRAENERLSKQFGCCSVCGNCAWKPRPDASNVEDCQFCALKAENERLVTQLRTTEAQWQMTGSAKQMLEAENEKLNTKFNEAVRLLEFVPFTVAEHNKLKAENEQLRKALEPLKAAHDEAVKFFHPHSPELRDSLPIKVTLGDCRRAAELLNRKTT